MYRGYVEVGASAAEVEATLKPIVVVCKKFQLQSLMRLLAQA